MKKNKPDVFAAIGDPTRRKILLLLAARALSINMLAGNFDVSRPAISKHIKALAIAKLISIEDKGRERFCSLERAGFDEIKDWLSFYDQFWKNKLSDLGDLLKVRSAKKK